MAKRSEGSRMNGSGWRVARCRPHGPGVPPWMAGRMKLDLPSDLIPKLARAFAPVCEITVLHDNSTFPPTIRAIGNGHVSGRSVGDSMTWSSQYIRRW